MRPPASARWVLAAALLIGARPALAEGPTAPVFEDDLKFAKAQMKLERWKEAAAAFRAIFERHRGSAEVVRRAGDIEADLKVSLYRAETRKPTPQDLFGEAVQSLEMGSRKVVLSYPHGVRKPHWEGTAGESGFLKIPFVGDVTLEFVADAQDERTKDFLAPFGILCYDAEKGTGYKLYPGFYYEDRYGPDKGYCTDPAQIVRLDGGRTSRELASKAVTPGNKDRVRCRASWKSGALMVKSPQTAQVNASDSKYSKGIVGVSGASVWDIEVRGTVEETHFRSLVAAYYETGFQAWIRESWDRDREIPDWVRGQASVGAGPSKPLLPSDAPDPPAEVLAEAMEAWRLGGYEVFVQLVDRMPALPARTGAYLDALHAMVYGRNAHALQQLEVVLQGEPECAAALLHRGIIRLHLRDLEGAGADLQRARAGAASMPSLHWALARLALQDGNLDGAHGHLSDAKVSGAWSHGLELLSRWVQTSREGPKWARRFESRNRNTIVVSDHSVELCREVAAQVERSWGLYGSEFPRTSKPKAPLRVWVFSNRDGYLRYAAELGRDLEKTAGAFFPGTGEMVLFVPDLARADFVGTVKHEAFHAYLDGFVQDAPTWFDEGYAQWFEAAEVKEGRLIPAKVHAPAAPHLRIRTVKSLAPLASLLCMDHAEFMKNPDLHYAEAWAFVQFLQESSSPPGRTLLRDYLESLRKGLTRQEAFDKHFEPLLPSLEAKFFEWIVERFVSSGR